MRTAIAFILAASPLLAGGLTEYVDDDPCDSPFPSYADYARTVVDADPQALYALASVIRANLCGDVSTEAPFWEKWAAQGFTEDQLLRAVFPGRRIDPPPPSTVPVPATWAALVLALVLLLAVKRK